MLLNPITDGVWECGDIKFKISDDFSTIEATQNGQTVVMQGIDITDLKRLMEINRDADPEMRSIRTRNMLHTNRSYPMTEW